MYPPSCKACLETGNSRINIKPLAQLPSLKAYSQNASFWILLSSWKRHTRCLTFQSSGASLKATIRASNKAAMELKDKGPKLLWFIHGQQADPFTVVFSGWEEETAGWKSCPGLSEASAQLESTAGCEQQSQQCPVNSWGVCFHGTDSDRLTSILIEPTNNLAFWYVQDPKRVYSGWKHWALINPFPRPVLP